MALSGIEQRAALEREEFLRLGGSTPSAPAPAPTSVEDLDFGDEGDGSNSVASLNKSNITDPSVPEGAEFNAVLQTSNPDEFLTTQNVGEIDQLQPQGVQEQTPFGTSTVDPALAGTAPTIDPVTGEVSEEALSEAAQSGGVADINAPQATGPGAVVAEQITGLEDVEAAQGELSPEAQVTAAQATESAEFAQAIASIQSELDNIAFDPRASVQEQYAQLVNFGPEDVPAWASGAIRLAEQKMAARGIFQNSSITAGAITTAVMESALPIAVADAQIFATWQNQLLDKKSQVGILRASHLANIDIQNLANRQQAAVENARSHLQIDLLNLDNEQQTRVINAQLALEVASQNTGLRQQAAIENARNFLQLDLANLDASTRAAIENARNSLTVEVANLNNRQSTAIENARAFLQMDLTNADRAQQSAIFNAQSMLQTMFSDQAAINAANQFNATSENQVNQFFAGLSHDVALFNSSQLLTSDQFNISMDDARERFNVQNSLLVDQANTQWLRLINTANTELLNEESMFNAQALLDISNTAIANALTLLRDKNAFTFAASESGLERSLRMSIAQLQANTNLSLANKASKSGLGAALGGLAGNIIGAWMDGDPNTGINLGGG